MRELWPRPDDDVAIEQRLADDPRPSPDTRPWVMVNMIASIDGATAVDGLSGELGGEGDARMFRAVRALPDAIVVGAATVRAENYGPARPSAAVRAARAARGQDPVPSIAVVTRGADLDPGLPLFTSDDPRPLVYVGSDAPDERRRRLAAVAEVVAADHEDLDLTEVLGDLSRRGMAMVLCEGGPSLNGQMVAGGLVDEWCLTLAPRLVAGHAARAAHGPLPPAPMGMVLHRVAADDEGYLFLNYRRG
ncbi:pyrimidine reductase family protein [Rhabdothermincola salaria]|uniref:pyrimidine reductase family protein n=1 Tax=Rhabdothermincola salaria TaxID=2903142 RepID=UPI001E4A53B3|nr:pyrimidine reductase family protein [Rhabdothermincola salaria]MCD9624875.1 pyrimidine reductase family protein [Rhabdothermincola salaria]